MPVATTHFLLSKPFLNIPDVSGTIPFVITANDHSDIPPLLSTRNDATSDGIVIANL
jgi:hypothetical protein